MFLKNFILFAEKDEQTALDQIAKMTQAQCRDSMQQLNQFYQATRSLTDQQRKDYFEQLVQEAKSRGQEPPPPPPTMGGRVFLALQACAKGSQ